MCQLVDSRFLRVLLYKAFIVIDTCHSFRRSGKPLAEIQAIIRSLLYWGQRWQVWHLWRELASPVTYPCYQWRPCGTVALVADNWLQVMQLIKHSHCKPTLALALTSLVIPLTLLTNLSFSLSHLDRVQRKYCDNQKCNVEFQLKYPFQGSKNPNKCSEKYLSVWCYR